MATRAASAGLDPKAALQEHGLYTCVNPGQEWRLVMTQVDLYYAEDGPTYHFLDDCPSRKQDSTRQATQGRWGQEVVRRSAPGWRCRT